MALIQDKKVKLYYSIKEVAQQFDLNESTLRYWENEFPQLKPRTVAGSKIRQYTEQDIEQVRLIYNLIKVRGFKIAAAKKLLKANPEGIDKQAEVLDKLLSIKSQLIELQKSLNTLQ